MKKTCGGCGFFGDRGWHGAIMAGFRGGEVFFTVRYSRCIRYVFAVAAVGRCGLSPKGWKKGDENACRRGNGGKSLSRKGYVVLFTDLSTGNGDKYGTVRVDMKKRPRRGCRCLRALCQSGKGMG